MMQFGRGTRFRLFPQAQREFAEPELVYVSPAAGTIGPGPCDAVMVAVDALRKRPYAPPDYGPPYDGASGPIALPDASGHFDHIAVDDSAFFAAHLYGAARFALDVWEKYLGRRVVWYHAETYPMLELIPLIDWDNAQSGPGFLETGARRNRAGEAQLFCLNFDIVAHEIGHAVLFSEVGVPDLDRLTPQFLAFHESFADIAALLAAMHFDSVIDHVLARTRGNLYAANMLNRFGEMSDTEQIRVADNMTTMADVAGLRLGPDGEWIDPAGKRRNAHHLAQPLTGAIFDCLVDLFQDGLAARGLIEPAYDARGWTRDEVETRMAALDTAMGEKFTLFEALFREALIDARDRMGAVIATVILSVAPDDLNFEGVSGLIVDAAQRAGIANPAAMAENFRWRGIEPGAAAPRAETRNGNGRMPRTAPYAQKVAALQSARHAAATQRSGAMLRVQRMVRHDHRAPAHQGEPGQG